MMMMQLKSRP